MSDVESLKIERLRERTRTALKLSATTKLPSLIDVDCNLTHKDLRDDAIKLVRMAFFGCGVRGMIVPGSSLDDSVSSLKLIRTLAASSATSCEFKSTAGVHPYFAGSNGMDDPQNGNMRIFKVLSGIRDLVHSELGKGKDGLVAAIGECGLDYSDGFPSPDIQLRVFEQQVMLACETKLPLFLHERDAFEDMARVLSRYKTTLPPILMHCFTGTKEQLAFYLSQGFYVSFSGVLCKQKRGADLRKSVHELRVQLKGRYMIETDAPYLGFPGCRFGCDDKPKRQYPNVPSGLPNVASVLATCLEETPLNVVTASSRLARSFFRMDELDGPSP